MSGIIMKTLLLLCVVAGAFAAPQESRSSQEPLGSLEELKDYLKKAQTIDNVVTLEEAMAANPLSSAWENSGKYQGDMLLMDEEVEQIIAEHSENGTQRTGLINPRNRWPSNTIIYDFQAGHYNPNQMRQAEAAFNMFNTRTCVRFRRRSNERDFVRLTRFSDGCYAHVGYWQGFGAHTLNLAYPGCFHPMVIMHEWLHVVGFGHMHQTYTRNNFVIINWANIMAGMDYAFDISSNQRVTMLGLPYEYASNQHYGPFAFSRNRLRTVVPRFNDNGLMGQLDFVSGYDILRVNRLYNCPGAWDAPVRSEDLNKPAFTVQDYEKALRELEKRDAVENPEDGIRV